MSFLVMASKEDFLMRPVLAGVLPYAEVNQTRLSLYDIALLNDALDVKSENDRRVWEEMEKNRGVPR